MAEKRSLIQEPFIHFAVLGVLLFALWGAVGEEEEEEADSSSEQILVTSEALGAMKTVFVEQHGEDPTDEQLQGLIDERVAEEILYRRGRAAGLDKGDPIVRRRVVGKMRMLVEELQPAAPPTDAEVDAWLSEHPDRYASVPSLAIEHVFFDAGRRTDPREDAQQALDAVHGGADIPPGGDPFTLGASLGLRPLSRFGAELGPGFADALSEATVGEWRLAPSTFGWHVVQVTERTAAGELTDAFARDQASFELQRQAREAAVDRWVAEQSAHYAVRVEGR